MSRARALCPLVGVVAVALTLAGCSLLAGVTRAATPSPGTPPVTGQCWNATAAQAAVWADWRGATAVACTRSHTLYTYHVGRISGEPANSWAAPGDAGSLTPEIQAKAGTACTLSTLLPHAKWNQQLIMSYFFVPTEAQWKAGARWIRCDVGVPATGTTLDNESFTALPTKISSFVGAVSSDPLRFEFCINSTTPVSESGPLDNPDATLANCKDNPQWKLTVHGRFPDAAGAPFPDDATSNAASSKLCLPGVTGDNEVWIAYLPTKATWASGDREIDCWVGQKSADSGSGGTA
jgi:Septum formation